MRPSSKPIAQPSSTSSGSVNSACRRSQSASSARSASQTIAWDSDAADDALWERLHAEFTEPELVELGCAIGFVLGQQHWERTLGLPPTAGLT